jgi:hypothetical protein
MTPPRLTELECPNCQAVIWVIDSDYPTLTDVIDWTEMMTPGDTLTLRRRDGGVLKLLLDQTTHSAVCIDAAGAVRAEATGLDPQAVHELSGRYRDGDVAGCAKQLRNSQSGVLP